MSVGSLLPASLHPETEHIKSSTGVTQTLLTVCHPHLNPSSTFAFRELLQPEVLFPLWTCYLFFQTKRKGFVCFFSYWMPYPSQAANAAGPDGLHQLVVSRPHWRGWPAALPLLPVGWHGPQGVLQLLQDATRLLFFAPFLAFLPFWLGRLGAARLVRPDDLSNHPRGLFLLHLLLRCRGRQGRWRRRRGWCRGSLLWYLFALGQFGRRPRGASGWAVRRWTWCFSLQKRRNRFVIEREAIKFYWCKYTSNQQLLIYPNLVSTWKQKHKEHFFS